LALFEMGQDGGGGAGCEDLGRKCVETIWQ